MVKLPENCPICGAKMEKGTLRAGGRGVDIRWGPPDMKFWTRGEIIKRGPFLSFAADLVAFRCTKCKLIMFFYEAKTEEKARK